MRLSSRPVRAIWTRRTKPYRTRAAMGSTISASRPEPTQMMALTQRTYTAQARADLGVVGRFAHQAHPGPRPLGSPREGGRADEGDGLENRWGRKSLQGSNPCPPASWPLGPLTDGVRSDRWTSNGGGTCVRSRSWAGL